MPAPARSLEVAGASVRVFDSALDACRAAADLVAETIRSAVRERGRAVLGLATGSTPIPVYARLAELHRAGAVSFADVDTYNLDEYYPIAPTDPQGFRTFMHRHLFAHVDLAANRAHLLDGTVPGHAVDEHAAQYDRWIAADGGLDLQLLGIGRNGHIGFNEPSDLPVDRALALPTRPVDLHPTTVADAVKDFGDEAVVPRRAITVGIALILAARSIVVLAFGPHKADAVARSLLGPVSAGVPGSLLRHADGPVTWLLDEAAARSLDT